MYKYDFFTWAYVEEMHALLMRTMHKVIFRKNCGAAWKEEAAWKVGRQ